MSTFRSGYELTRPLPLTQEQIEAFAEEDTANWGTRAYADLLYQAHCALVFREELDFYIERTQR